MRPSPCRLVAALALLATPTMFAAEGATSFEEAISGGSYSGMLRYRGDYYDEDNGGASDAAFASTLRSSMMFQTKPLYGFSGALELYYVGFVGDDDYSPETPGYDFVIDPAGKGLNQGFGRYETSAPFPVTFTVGRQLWTINDETFVTASRYRQNNNRFDAATTRIEPIEHLSFDGGFLWQNNDVGDGEAPMASVVGNLAYAFPEMARVAAFVVVLDYDDETRTDRTTFGVRADGPWKIDDDMSIIYEAEFAQQNDSGDTEATLDATMITVRGGLAYKKWYGSVGYRQSTGVNDSSDLAFQSSDLGYPWPWRGNSEQMVFYPADGLQTIMVWVGGAIPAVEGLSFDAFFFDFSAVEESTAFGSEISGGLNYNVTKRLSLYGLVTAAEEGDEDNGVFRSATRATGMITFTF